MVALLCRYQDAAAGQVNIDGLQYRPDFEFRQSRFVLFFCLKFFCLHTPPALKKPISPAKHKTEKFETEKWEREATSRLCPPLICPRSCIAKLAGSIYAYWAFHAGI
jgi:hypothetical protein